MRIVTIGEGMLELSRAPSIARSWQLLSGGDMLNVTVHLARLRNGVSFFTALGDDPFSDELRENWSKEGIDLGLVLSLPGARPGLYAISTAQDGERSFGYWRNESAARSTFSLAATDAAIATAETADMLVFSVISLAILPAAGRDALLAMAGRMRRAGKRIAFDGNYRPGLWRDVQEARAVRDRAISCCTIGLPSLDDERLLEGPCTAVDISRRWAKLGSTEIVVKAGGEGCLLPDETWSAPPSRLSAVDTSGAGDAFDAAYLHHRLNGHEPAVSAMAGHRLAAWVVMRAGACPPLDDDAPYTCL